MVRSKNMIFFSIFEWNTGNGRDRSTSISLGDVESLNYFVFGD